MITFLASPKPFQGIAKEHQYRAIRSWQATGKDVEVILYGDSSGIDEAGDDLGVQVVKPIASSPSGTPYFGAIADHAAVHARHDLQMYLNCDILLSDIVPAMKQIHFPQFLLIGQRIDLGEGVDVDVTQPGWQATLQRLADQGKAMLHPPSGIDYFGFRRGIWKGLPSVTIGRGGYDQALMVWCLRHHIPIVDATFRIIALHQNHDYGHLSGGVASVFQGCDARQNLRSVGVGHSVPLISDANFMLRRGSLVPCAARGDWLRRSEMKLRFEFGMERLGLLLRAPWRVLYALGWRPEFMPGLQDVLNEAFGEFEHMAKKIRAAFFSRYFPDYRNGVFSRLARHPDIEFSFYAEQPPSGSFIHASDSKPYECRPIRIFSLPIPGTHNRISYRAGPVSALLRRQFDVLILSNDILGVDIWLCSILSRLMRVPVCIWGQGLSRPPSRFRNALRFALTSLANAAIYYTDGGRDYWAQRRIPRRKLFVAYNALNTDEQIPLRKAIGREELDAHRRAHGLTGKKVVTFLGRLIPEKRPDLFIDVVAHAAAKDPAITGVIVGDGPEKSRLEKYVQDQCLTDRIRFVGATYDEPSMARHLLSSVAVVIPAFGGLAIQHASVYGAPVILGDVEHSHGPEQELVEHEKTGLWCAHDNVDAFAAAIHRLASDPPYRDRLSANAMRLIDERYNVSNMAQGFVAAVRYCAGE